MSGSGLRRLVRVTKAPKTLLGRVMMIESEVYVVRSGRDTHLVGEIEGDQLELLLISFDQRTGSCYLDDRTGAQNSTLNGVPVLERVRLICGDAIEIGEISLVYQEAESEAEDRTDDEAGRLASNTSRAPGFLSEATTGD